jgi:predicted NAD-dependent protein-ADP-ribosyltransferase YbiA (DUF1768 family)
MSKIIVESYLGEYGPLSNHYGVRSCMIHNGLKFGTVEHLFSYLKYDHDEHPLAREYAECIRKCETPSGASFMSRQFVPPTRSDQDLYKADVRWAKKHHICIRRDWNSIERDMLKYAMILKFVFDQESRECLLSTSGEIIACGYSADFRRHLEVNCIGNILMEIREELRCHPF